MYHISVFEMRVTIKKYGDTTYKVIFHKCSNSGLPFRYDDENASSAASRSGEKEDCNLYRAKSKIREYALCNPWSYFVTLTIDSKKQDRYNVDEYVRDLGVWIGNYNKKYGCKLSYLLIPEQHKDGAWHMHGLFGGVAPDSLITNKHGYCDMPYYSQRFGYISLSPVRDSVRTASYITKYVAKALGHTAIELCKHSYYHSRGLALAETIGETSARYIPDDIWSNDYCGVAWCGSDDELAALLERIEVVNV